MESYEIFRYVSYGCYAVAGVLLIAAVLMFILWKIPQLVSYLSGRARRKGIARMRQGEVGVTGNTVIDMNQLEKQLHSSGRLNRRITGRTARQPAPPPMSSSQPVPPQEPPRQEPGTQPLQQEPQRQPVYAAAPAYSEPETVVITHTSNLSGDPVQQELIQPVPLTILDDIVLIHTNKFIEIE